MASEKVTSILEEIKGLSVIELFDLEKAIEDEFGVSAAAVVAVGGGACADEMLQAVSAGCDTFVTADCAYHNYYDAQFRGINLIDAGHLHTENPVCTMLQEKLQAAFPDVKVLLSKQNQDVAKFF